SETRVLTAVLAVHLATTALITMKYRTLFGRLGVRVPPFTMARAYIRRHVIGVVVPFGGPVGLVQFVKDFEQQNIRSGTTLCASLMATLVNEISFFLDLIPTFAWLAIAGRATSLMGVGLITLGTIFLVVLTSLLIMMFRGSVPAWLAARIPARIEESIAEIQAHHFGLRDIA